MSKQLRRKNIPAPSSAPSSEDDDDLSPAVALPTMEGGGDAGTSDPPGVQDVTGSAGPSALVDADEGWRHVAAQLESLKAVLTQLCTLVTSTTSSERPSGDHPTGALPTLSALSNTRHETAILGMAGEERREAAILPPPPRGAAILNTLRSDAILLLPQGSPSMEDGGAETRSHQMTFVDCGGLKYLLSLLKHHACQGLMLRFEPNVRDEDLAKAERRLELVQRQQLILQLARHLFLGGGMLAHELLTEP
ncbi:unnamed protein product [Lampetra fluviatilis]